MIKNFLMFVLVTGAAVLFERYIFYKHERLENALSDLKGKLMRLENVTDSPSVAFYAVYSGGHKTMANLQPAIYDKVYTNIGNAYNAYTGIFTAPVNGLYVFGCTLLGLGKELHLQMLANDNEIGRGYSNAGCGSIHAVVSLNKNDVVRLQHIREQSEVMHGYNWNSFSGYLIST